MKYSRKLPFLFFWAVAISVRAHPTWLNRFRAFRVFRGQKLTDSNQRKQPVGWVERSETH